MWFIFSLGWFCMILLPGGNGMGDYYHSESSYYAPSWNPYNHHTYYGHPKPIAYYPGWGHEEPKTCAIKIDDGSHGFHEAKYDTFENHPCRRKCIKGRHMVCRYKIVTHHYHSMGKECKNCLKNPRTCNAEHCIPFGGVASSLVVANHHYPSPIIEVCLYDTIEVKLYNNLTEPTVMHWHGFHMSETPESDGAPMVTQNLIQPGDTYSVCFKVDRPGTLWYHSHVGWQRAEGMAGPLVVHTAREDNTHRHLYDCDKREHVIFIQDVVINGDFTRPQNLLINGKGRQQNVTIPDDDPGHCYERIHVHPCKCYRIRFISNGIFNCPVEVSIAHHTMTIIALDGNDIEPMKANKFHVASGERIDIIVCANQKVGTYWISFKGMSDCGSLHQNAIFHYKDAPAHQIPKTFVAVPSTGRTAKNEEDVIVNAIAEYWDPSIMRQSSPVDVGEQSDDMSIRVVENSVAHETSPGVARKFAHDNPNLYVKDIHGVKPIHRLALPDDIAEYTGKKIRNRGRSTAVNLTSSTVSTVGLRSVHPVDWDANTKCKTYYFALGILVVQGEVAFEINNITFATSTMSLLQNNDKFRDDDYFCNRTSMENANIDCRTNICKCTHVVRIPACECIEFVIVNLMSSTHPFHFHGHTFRVLAQQPIGNATILRNIEEYDRLGLIPRLPSDYPAVEKDVVQVPGLGVAVFRFQSTNPGYWMAHCHIERHGLFGMKVVIKVGENNQIKKQISKSKCFDYTCYR